MSELRSDPPRAQRANFLLRLPDAWQGQEMRQTQSRDWRARKLLRQKLPARECLLPKLPAQAELSARELERKPELEPKRKAVAVPPVSPIRTVPKTATPALDFAQDSPTNLTRMKSSLSHRAVERFANARDTGRGKVQMRCKVLPHGTHRS